MKKTIVLNIVELTPKKLKILRNFFFEYLRVSNIILEKLQDAKSQNQLHYLTYYEVRKNSFLPSDIIEEARKDVWAKRKRIKGKIKSCSIRLNSRWFKLIETKRENPCFKITYAPEESFVIPIRKDKQLQRFNSFLSGGWTFSCISLLKDGRIAVHIKKDFEKSEINQRYVIGIDIGSSTLAAITIFDTKTSKIIKQLYFGRDVAIRQERYSKRRAKLQSLTDRGSERAKKSLKRLRNKQVNYVKTRSGQIAKEIVNLAIKYNAYVAIEKLKNIRAENGKFSKEANKRINRIPYRKFIEFLKSNCEMFGIPIHEIDAYHTSKWCPHCGAVNEGHQTGNYSLYKCKCGLVVNSDRKASLAVAVKSVLERTRVSRVQISNAEVPVNGLFRPDEVGKFVAVQQDANEWKAYVLVRR